MITKSHDASRLTLPLGDGAVSCDIAEMLLQKYVANKYFYKSKLQKNAFQKIYCKNTFKKGNCTNAFQKEDSFYRLPPLLSKR